MIVTMKLLEAELLQSVAIDRIYRHVRTKFEVRSFIRQLLRRVQGPTEQKAIKNFPQ